MSIRDLIIVGAGPSGLSAAIAAKRRGLDYQVLEQGVLVNSIYRFPPQMVFFTTPELLEIGGLPFVSPYEKPTRPEALRYYRKVVDTYDLRISFDETVLTVSREDLHGAGQAEQAGRPTAAAPAAMPRLEADPSTPLRVDPSRSKVEASASERAGGGAPAPVQETMAETLFAVETRTSRGVRRARHARTLIFATGYYDHPVMLNVPGEDLAHVHHFYGDPHPYYRQRVVIVGGGNSAAEAALELYRAGASVTLVHRGSELKPTIKYWVRPDIENRFKEGSIAARFNSVAKEIRPTSVVISTTAATADTASDSRGRAFDPSAGSGSSRSQSRDDRLRLDPSRVEGRESALEAEGRTSDGANEGWGPSTTPEAEPSTLRPAQGRPEPSRGTTGSGSTRAGSRVESLGSRPRQVEEDLPADAVFLLVGYRANTDLFVRAGVQLTDREGPVHNPDTFETNVAGLFVAGGAIAGVDTGTIFIENGRFHGEKIVEEIARRLERGAN